MTSLRHIVRDLAPGVIGDLLFTALNVSQYRLRHSGAYRRWREYYASHLQSGRESLEREQASRLSSFLEYCQQHSTYYRSVLGGCDVREATPLLLRELPVLEKKELISKVKDIMTMEPSEGLASMTGGTTGNSMTVYHKQEDVQERFAFVDTFRAQAGYSLGSRIAWATGKEIVSRLDVRLGRYYRRDFVNRILFISTFHLNSQTFEKYWEQLERHRPEYLLGFPSFFHELAAYAAKRGLRLNGIRAYFPTAETVTSAHRELISDIFGCEIIDQYASSEGAPFIVQCRLGRYHLQPHTGVFEVVDDEGRPSEAGEMLVTSFSTRGTPLIRYRIGDSVALAPEEEHCPCGFGGRLVERIDGRKADFITTPSGAKISSVNFSNATKGIKGIDLYQIEQCSPDDLVVRVVATNDFNANEERLLVKALQERVGSEMNVAVSRVASIARERSGKFRVIKGP